MFDPTDPDQQRFHGYGPAPLPNHLDDEVDAFVTRAITGAPRSMDELLPRLSEEGRRVLAAYAERMASLAVRAHDRAVLVKALVALILGGLDENRRESLMVMAPIEDAADRSGTDLTGLFAEVSRIVGHPGTANLAMWLSRQEEDRSLKSMGFVATEEADGFRYQLDW